MTGSEGASKRGFGGPQRRQCALQSGQFWCGAEESGSPCVQCTEENWVSWNPEWFEELDLLATRSRLSPVLTLELSLHWAFLWFVHPNSPSILHDAAQPAVRTLAVP